LKKLIKIYGLFLFPAVLFFAMMHKSSQAIFYTDINVNPAAITEDPYIKFDHLTRKNGLSCNYVLDFLQDNYGFLWIATKDGLNRYDGKKIIIYRNIKNDSTSISDNLVTCIGEDESGQIWIGTKRGLNLYNRSDNSFGIAKLINDDGATIGLNDYIRAILPDRNSILWIETAKGKLIRYNTVDHSFKIFEHSSPGMVNTYLYHTIFKENDTIIWVGGRFMGIYRFNTVTGIFHKFRADKNDKTKKRESDVAVYFVDSQGKMWIGGTDGLYVFNAETEVFSKMLKVSTFTAVEDDNGNIWFGTGSGIYLYSLSDSSFTIMKSNDNNPNSLIKNHINKIYIDNSYNIWIGTTDGVSVFRPSKNKFRHIYHIPGEDITPGSSNITSILQLKSGEIWVGTENHGIDCLNEKFIRKYSFSSSGRDGYKLNSDNISVLMQDSDGDIWAGQWSGKGFNIINPLSHRIKSYSLLKNSLKADWYNDIYEDSRGNFWIGFWGASGLYQFDKGRGVFKDRTFILKSGLPSGAVKKLFYDGKVLWTVFEQQIFFYSLNLVTERVNSYLKDNYSSYDFNRVIDLAEDNTGELMFKTNNGIYRKQEDPYISIKLVNRPFPVKRNVVDKRLSVLLKDYGVDTILCKTKYTDGSVWAGTFNGLFLIKEDNNIRQYSRSSNEGLISDTVWSLALVSPDIIWLGTGKGLCKFNIETNEISPFIYDEKSYLSSHLVKCIAEDKDGYIWVGTTNKGLNRLDPNTGTVVRFESDVNDSLSFWGDEVSCILIDGNGTLYAGGLGLNIFNRNSETFSHFTVSNGLTDNNITAILEDDKGRLWLSTLNGLSVFNPVNEGFVNFYEKDGLQDNEFSNAACKLFTGELAFGGKNGITVCNPSHIFINKRPPDLSIISFSVFDRKKDFNPASNKRMELKYDENYFSVEYAALDFSNPENVEYAYKLDGVDKDWIYTDASGRIAKYTNIDPGEYRFRVKATNGDGVWNDAGIFLDIIINPPFWKTYWFIFLEIVALLFAVILIIRYREKKLKERNKFQLLEQKLLRSQMNPHFIFNSLSSIQSFIFENDPVEAGSYLSRFAELIRSILYNSREEFITVEEETKTLKNYFLLQQLRYNNKFEYTIDIDPLIQPDTIKIPPMLAQPFIENAIEHGIKHIKGKGKILVSFTLIPEKEAVLLTIEDNGIGIAASRKLKNSHKKGHTSLATVIANERIEVLNKGRRKNYFYLTVGDILDNEGNVIGTRVKFIIPYRKQIV
jgi:ligand-binding sensor domain-containing protein/signal transduction histidine kinase